MLIASGLGHSFFTSDPSKAWVLVQEIGLLLDDLNMEIVEGLM